MFQVGSLYRLILTLQTKSVHDLRLVELANLAILCDLSIVAGIIKFRFKTFPIILSFTELLHSLPNCEVCFYHFVHHWKKKKINNEYLYWQ